MYIKVKGSNDMVVLFIRTSQNRFIGGVLILPISSNTCSKTHVMMTPFNYGTIIMFLHINIIVFPQKREFNGYYIIYDTYRSKSTYHLVCDSFIRSRLQLHCKTSQCKCTCALILLDGHWTITFTLPCQSTK